MLSFVEYEMFAVCLIVNHRLLRCKFNGPSLDIC